MKMKTDKTFNKRLRLLKKWYAFNFENENKNKRPLTEKEEKFLANDFKKLKIGELK